MLRWRLLLGTLVIAALAGLCKLDFELSPPGVLLMPLALLLILAATQECLALTASAGLVPFRGASYGGNVLIWTAAVVSMTVFPAATIAPRLAWVLAGMVAAMFWGIVSALRQFRPREAVVGRLAGTVWVQGYVGLLMALMIQLRPINGRVGMVALLSMIVVTKMGDIGAYTVGRLLGRHKMAPVLSPGKTWEGAAGALLFGILGGAWSLYWLAPRLVYHVEPPALWRVVLYSVLVATAGLLGDLTESLLKRAASRKDSSAWMPGFGGILDLLDSLLVAAPVALACWAAGLVSL